MDVNPGPSHYRVTDPDMALGGSSGPDDIWALGDIAGHPDLYGPSCSMVPS